MEKIRNKNLQGKKKTNLKNDRNQSLLINYYSNVNRLNLQPKHKLTDWINISGPTRFFFLQEIYCRSRDTNMLKLKAFKRYSVEVTVERVQEWLYKYQTKMVINQKNI